MAQAQKKTDDADQVSAPKHSLKKRLHAWWEGYELRPVPGNDTMAGDADEDGSVGGEDGDDGAAAEDVPEWSAARQELTQLIWGEGFVSPGTPESVVELAQPFGLTAENTMLEIGSGPAAARVPWPTRSAPTWTGSI